VSISKPYIDGRTFLRKLLFTLVGLIAGPVTAAEREPQKAAAGIEIAGSVLMVTDLERSLKFYVDGLGLQASTRLPSNAGPGVIMASPGHPTTPFLLIGQSAADPKQSSPVVHGNGLSRVMLVVPYSAAAAARLTAAGFPHEPVNALRIFFVEDPDGFRYEIMQRDSRH
jgi:catechol 2,3-dioxygenase-like lactoylglutathione lyase family enzyme